MCVLSIKVPIRKSLETYLMILVYTVKLATVVVGDTKVSFHKLQHRGEGATLFPR